MKVSSEKIESCQVALTVEVEPEEMEKAMDDAYRRMARKVAIPGFRKGKAPRPLFERHVGRESIESEALEELIPQLYQEAVEQEEITSIGQPDMEMVQKDPPIFKATIPVPPEVELGDYHSIRVATEPVEITEENIEQGIDNLRKMHATQEPVEYEVQFDDIVTLDIKATVDDEVILDREADSFRVTEGTDVPAPGFAEELVGMTAGDQKTFTLTFPEEHSNSEIAGKQCQFDVSISAVKIEVLPELNDEFAKSLGEDIETVAQLRQRLEENMRKSAERESRQKLESDVIEALANISTVEFPPVFTEQEIDRLASEQMQRFGGMEVEDFLRYRGITEAQFRDELRPTAEHRVRSSLILNKVHDVENIEVTSEEIDAEIDRMIAESGQDSEHLRNIFASGPGQETVRDRLLTQKTFDRLIEIATAETETETDDQNAEAEAGEEGPEMEGDSQPPEEANA